MVPVFVKALLLGFSVAAPVGPIGVLCIRRTLTDGRRVGFFCGLGAATADALYGLVAGLGVAAISSSFSAQQRIFRVVGACYLAYLAYCTVRAEVPREGANAAKVAGGGALSAWLSTFGLTVTNPMTIAAFAAMFSSFGIVAGASVWDGTLALVAGVFLGSAAWWFTLSGGVSLVRQRLSRAHLVWVNRASGVCLFGFALAAVLSP
ncbi:LysE family translocator [Pendulispora albinea]|uniref:LysE family translocator n=1 Tax=Pendulispora albinea TaxID=2741071 RepID=A0ABZ2M371_9BACT